MHEDLSGFLERFIHLLQALDLDRYADCDYLVIRALEVDHQERYVVLLPVPPWMF